MKKALIALAVTASVTVSGAAMAATWTPSGTSGTVSFSGTLTAADNVTPWEVLIGDAVANLDADVKKGQNKAVINVTTAIPVLGIRTQSKSGFDGAVGLAPQITYGSSTKKVLGTTWAAGVNTLTLDVVNPNDATAKLGELTVPFVAAAYVAYKSNVNATGSKFSLYAATAGQGFFGGLPTAADTAISGSAVAAKVNALSSEITANLFVPTEATNGATYYENFGSGNVRYSAYYGAGIEAGKDIKITLTDPVTADATTIPWKANLPVTISYQ